MTEKSDQPTEVEISLADEAALELRAVEFDSAELPLAFSVEGVIRDIDSDVMEELEGKELDPIAVRFRLFDSDS